MIGIIGSESQVAGFGLVGMKSLELQKKTSIETIKKTIESWKEVKVCIVPIHLKDPLQTHLPEMFFIAIPQNESTQSIKDIIQETLGMRI